MCYKAVQVPEALSAGRNKKGRKRPSFTGKRGPGRRWEDLSLWQISSVSFDSGPCYRNASREITFEPGSNEALGSRFFP